MSKTKQTTTETPAAPINPVVAQFKAARRVSAPILVIKTPDPAATIREILNAYTAETCPPALRWDCVRGVEGINQTGKAAVGSVDADSCVNPVDMLAQALKLPGASATNPRGAVLFMQAMHRFISEAQVAQAIWNVRDAFKTDRRTLVLLAPEVTLPVELTNDCVIIDEPLPQEKQVAEIVRRIFKDADAGEPTTEALAHAVNATLGMPSFPVEQVVAMSLTDAGLDQAALWERKRQAVEQTPGLKIWRGGESFEAIQGYENLKGFLKRYVKGKKAPRVVVFMDEIEKQLGGAAGDTSGTSQDQLGSMLAFMQDNRCDGILLLGPGGTGKSTVAKATGNFADVPTVALDLGAAKDSLVGGSEARIRQALKVIKAIGGEKILFVATCNSIGILPPELRRRFKSGTFFMDLPGESEREALWKMYIAKHGITGKAATVPASVDWTGAEIEQACEYASNMGVSLTEAAQYIVPVSKSAAELIANLRKTASGRFISASKPGLYELPQVEEKTGRAVNVATMATGDV